VDKEGAEVTSAGRSLPKPYIQKDVMNGQFVSHKPTGNEMWQYNRLSVCLVY